MKVPNPFSPVLKAWGNLIGGTKASAVGRVISSLNLGLPVWSERRYDKFAEEAYIRNAVAFRCIKLIASAAASAPYVLHGRKGQLVDRSPLLELLARPSPASGGETLFEAFYAYLLIAGNSYMEAVGPSRKDALPRELWVHRPDRMKVVPGKHGLPNGYEYEAGGLKASWDVDLVTGKSPILHMKEFHPLNDWYGLSRVEPAGFGIDRHNAAAGHNKALLDNGARPTGALIFEPVTVDGKPQNAPAEVIEAARKELELGHGGPANAGKSFVYGGNVKWEEMGLSPRDMDFADGKLDAARDICLAFGVPHILVVPGQATYNNIREAKLELWEDTVLPLLGRGTGELNNWLTPRFGDDLELVVDLDSISALEPRREIKRKTVTELLDKGVIDADEARDELQYGPRDANSVKKVDAAVLTALVNAVDQAGFDPLVRYLRSVGLYDPSLTDEEILNRALGLLEDDEDDDDGTGDDPAAEGDDAD